MAKPLKLFVAIFVGLDIFFVLCFGLLQLRFALFGEGQIPGGGSALDMALFLIPLFVAYVAGDRLYYFLTYKERKAAQSKQPLTPANPVVGLPESLDNEIDSNAQPVGSVWDDRGWENEPRRSEK